MPKCVSNSWPKFIRLGTPSGLSTTSTGVPSAKYGISSTGKIRATTPLLPWRPAILSPTLILRSCATKIWICISTPAFNSWPFSRLKTLTPTTLPPPALFMRCEVSRTSLAFSPKIARSKRSSELSSCSPFGVILPTKTSPARTSEPTCTIPSSSR